MNSLEAVHYEALRLLAEIVETLPTNDLPLVLHAWLRAWRSLSLANYPLTMSCGKNAKPTTMTLSVDHGLGQTDAAD